MIYTVIKIFNNPFSKSIKRIECATFDSLENAKDYIEKRKAKYNGKYEIVIKF